MAAIGLSGQTMARTSYGRGSGARRATDARWAIVGGLLGIVGVLLPAMATGADPQPRNSWQELGQLNVGRWGCRVHDIDGQRAIVFAGWGDAPFGPADSSAEILDLTSGDWTLAAPMPAGFVPGANPWTAKLKDGYFLVAGGFNAVGTGSRMSYVYSVSRDAWIRTGDLPIGATVGSNFGQTDAIVLDDGRILAAGGLAIDNPAETKASVVFTPNYANLQGGMSGEAVGTWDFTRDQGGHVTSLKGRTEHHKLIKLKDGRVLLIVGYDQRFVNQKFGDIFSDTRGVQAELYDPATGVWTALPNMPAIPGEDDRHDGVKGIRQQATIALLGDGRVLVAGGFSEPTDAKGRPLLKDGYYERSSAILFDPELYSRGAYPWSITNSMHVARDSHAMGNLPGSAGIISVWGRTQDAWTRSAEVYDPRQGVWRFVTGLPSLQGTDRSISRPLGCTAMLASGNVLVVGGSRDEELGGRSGRTYLYRP